MENELKDLKVIKEGTAEALPHISDYIDKSHPVPIEKAEPLSISGDNKPKLIAVDKTSDEESTAVTITGGKTETLKEVPDFVKEQIKADAKAAAEASKQATAKVPKLDPNDPLNKTSEKQLVELMKQVRQMIGMYESIWTATKKEFSLTDAQMKALYAYNQEHAEPMPEGKDGEQEEQEYNVFNGLNNMTEEDVLAIFGEGHPIIGVEHSQTMDRVKSVAQDYWTWMSTMREYQHIHDGYIELIELQEEKEITALKEYCEKETDPEKKAKMQTAINLYYNRKYIDFIKDPLDDLKMKALVKAFSSQSKVMYLIDRARTKLQSLHISQKFILEISQLEKRFLPEEYHSQNNIFLLYFMNLLVFSNSNDKNDQDKNKAMCIVIAMDKFVRNAWGTETKERITSNLIEFEKQFVGKLPVKKADEPLQ